jgi:hypothetical protein
MALLWVDSFEKYGTGNGVPISPGDVIKWKYVASFDERYDVYDGRYGGHSLAQDNLSASMMTPDLSAQDRTLIVGFNFKLEAVSDNYTLVNLRHPNLDGETVGYVNLQFRIDTINGANQISVAFNNPLTPNGTTTSLDIQPDTWYHFEAKVFCDNTVGTANLKIDGVEVLSFIGDTRHRNYPEADRYSRVQFYALGETARCFYDDFYVMDTTGTVCNDFLGPDTRVASISPASDASGNWTPSTGGDMFAMVDEDTLDANYIESMATGNQAMFEMTNLSVNEATGTVQGIMACCDSQQMSEAAKYAKFISSNGAGSIEHTGNFAPGRTNPYCHTQVMENDPDGNPWTPATINSLRAGVEVS